MPKERLDHLIDLIYEAAIEPDAWNDVLKEMSRVFDGAAVMLGTQFWHPGAGGIYVGWYLPLLLLTVFRPNLEDRVALSVLLEPRIPRRLAQLAGLERAA